VHTSKGAHTDRGVHTGGGAYGWGEGSNQELGMI
jgi:hypothetical protein